MTDQITINLNQPLKQARAEFERAYFEHHVAAAGKAAGAKKRITRTTEMERTAVYRKLRKLGIGVR